MTSDGRTDENAEILAGAERVLSEALGGPVRIEEGEVLRGTVHRSRVLRRRIVAGPSGAPASVIIKCALRGEGDGADPPDRLFREWAGVQFLSAIPAEPLLCPRLYGADRAASLIVLEDLGPGECLADRLQGEDRAAVEAGLLAYARTLGLLHAATAGREEEFDRLQRSLGAKEQPEPKAARRIGEWRDVDVPKFRQAAEALGIAPAAGFDDEVESVARVVEEPGPFLAYSPGDTCPDNHRFVGDRLRLFDFEFCGFGHALLDAAYWRVPFPTCWCVNRLPAGIGARLDAVYRSKLAVGVPEAAEDSRFYDDFAATCAWWAIATVSWHLLGALEKDGDWGISTLRQRQILRLESIASLAAEFGRLDAIGETARQMASRLRARWPEVEMPLYPPFRRAETDAFSPDAPLKEVVP